MARDADLDLLFGLLALQTGLIDQAALVAGFQAWTRDRSRPLAQHLIDLGRLDPDDRPAVEALAARHLKKHQDDPERSLAALPPAPAVREALASLQDAAIDATIAHIPGPGDPAIDGSRRTEADPDPDPDRTMTRGLAPAGPSGSRFVALRPHAKGGIGQVSIALDTELHREVALKEIQPILADEPAARARFLLEAEVTGRLEHPGVVPVYGLGADAQGHPYYAMRFIRGDSLKRAIERFHQADGKPGRDPSERTLALRNLLGRFVDVCNAIAYAHSRGVIHRDIKPSNVMLGPYGETLVVDWGLAKVVGRDDPVDTAEATLRPAWAGGSGSSETQAGTAIGTPAFMSPEQAEGKLEAIGPASDIYALGATLSCLLSGRPPVEGEELATVLRRVREGDFPSPREVNPRVPAPLDAIARRAMALRPADRYPNARALAEDIEHWLADEPVSAHREGLPARLARYARRHKTGVATAAALLLTATAALGLGTILLGRANAVIQEQRNLARSQRDLARENFDKARAAVNTYLTQVSEEQLLNQPGLEPLREKLLRSALTYYQDFIRQRGDDPSLRRELADAYRRAGQITGEIGSRTEARSQLDRATELFRALVDASPDDLESRAGLARSLASLAYFQIFDDDPIGGGETALRAAELFGSLRDARPDSAEFARMVGRSYGLAAVGAVVSGRASEFGPLSARSIELLEEAVARFPDDLESKRLLALARSNAGGAAQIGGDLEGGLNLLRRSLELSRQLQEAEPGNVTVAIGTGRTLTNVGRLLISMGRFADAVGPLREAVALTDRLAATSPDVSELTIVHMDALERLALAEHQFGRDAAASGLIRRSLAEYERLSRRDASNDDALESLADAYVTAYRIESAAGFTEAAREAIDRALDAYRRLLAEGDTDAGYRASLGLAREARLLDQPPTEDADERRRRLDDARALLADREAMQAEAPDDPERRLDVARSWSTLARLHRDAGDADPAGEAIGRASAILDDLEPRFPERLTIRKLRVEALLLLARLEADRGEREAAAATVARAVAAAGELAELDPSYRVELARAHARAVALAADDPEPHRGAAIDALRLTLDDGFDNAEAIRLHPDWAPLRDLPAFDELLRALPASP